VNIYKIYAKSFRGQDHLRRILDEEQVIVNDALATVTPRSHGLGKAWSKRKTSLMLR
jgi:hypothetical protein